MHPLTSARPPALRTARLRLQPATLDDLDALHALWNAPDVRRFLFDDRPVDRTLAAGVLHDALDAAGDGHALWLLRPLDGAGPVGCAGLLPSTVAATYAPELAGATEALVALDPAHWGRGYAVDALAALSRHAFATLGRDAIAAVADAPNVRSIRMLEAAGFRFQRTVDGPAYPLRVYRLPAPASR